MPFCCIFVKFTRTSVLLHCCFYTTPAFAAQLRLVKETLVFTESHLNAGCCHVKWPLCVSALAPQLDYQTKPNKTSQTSSYWSNYPNLPEITAYCSFIFCCFLVKWHQYVINQMVKMAFIRCMCVCVCARFISSVTSHNSRFPPWLSRTSTTFISFPCLVFDSLDEIIRPWKSLQMSVPVV